VPFANGTCPKAATRSRNGLKFCSKSEIYGAVGDIDTDVMELTGDHLAIGGGSHALPRSDLYRERWHPYYGGGYNQEDGRSHC